jgi:DNA-directed RNA polymerase subunit omega
MQARSHESRSEWNPQSTIPLSPQFSDFFKYRLAKWLQSCLILRPGSLSVGISGFLMKAELVEKAAEIVTDPLVLINLVSQRVRQLNSGRSPLIPTRPSMGAADIALTEIIEGKIRLIEVAAPA